MESISNNLLDIKQTIRETAHRVGRNPDEIELVVVTKTRSLDQIKEVIEAGHTLLGENRVQEALGKIPQFPNTVSWHLIGHLQTNKARDAVKAFDLIHSVDSERLANALNKQALRFGKTIDVCIEVNTSGEATKFGIAPKQTPQLVKTIAELPNTRICGMMTMAPFVAEDEIIRCCFRSLRQLRDEIVKMQIPGVEMKYLSMGMTNDYVIAIEEGANILRIGSAIFQ